MSAEKFNNQYRIPSARASWHGYDGGLFFITVCTAGREHYLGEIVKTPNDSKNHEYMVSTPTDSPAGSVPTMKLSAIGQYSAKCIEEISLHFPNAEIPLYVVMPNHIHLIVKW